MKNQILKKIIKEEIKKILREENEGEKGTLNAIEKLNKASIY